MNYNILMSCAYLYLKQKNQITWSIVISNPSNTLSRLNSATGNLRASLKVKWRIRMGAPNVSVSISSDPTEYTYSQLHFRYMIILGKKLANKYILSCVWLIQRIEPQLRRVPLGQISTPRLKSESLISYINIRHTHKF